MLQVAENADIGHEVGLVEPLEKSRNQLSMNDSFEDRQAEAQLFESLTVNTVSKDILESAFDIDRHRGSLIVTRPLDREQQSEYKLEIRSLDTRTSNNPQSSAITVCIEVTDINDNSPVWPHDPLVIQVSESTPDGSLLYNFSATDNDIGVNGQVQYRLLSYTPSPERQENGQAVPELFQVDILTGGLLLLHSLDYEMVREYTLVVQAYDLAVNESERFFSTATVHLQVLDENDNEPLFMIPPSIIDSNIIYDLPTSDSRDMHDPKCKTANIYTNNNRKIGDILTRIVAMDRDSGNNGLIRYTIESGNSQGYFRLNAETGHLKLAKTLPTMPVAKGLQGMVSNTHSKYELKIRAQDQADEKTAKYSHLKLNIFIRSIKNNPPCFQQSVYYANVSENAASGTFVIQIAATLSFTNAEIGM